MSDALYNASVMDVFAAVAEPTRRAMLGLLAAREHAAGELVLAFPTLSQPAVSRHLRILREAGLVQVRPSEQRRMYSLRPEGLREIDAWLATYRKFWVSRLDALEKHLEERARSSATKQHKPKKRKDR